MTLRFRNIAVSPDDPVASWGFEGLLAAIERGSMNIWARIAAEVRAHPRGAVASLLDEEVIDAIRPEAERELFRRILQRARQRADEASKAEVARRLRAMVAASGFTQREFAKQLGTSASRLNTYLNGKVTPGADLMVRAERLCQQVSGLPDAG